MTQLLDEHGNPVQTVAPTEPGSLGTAPAVIETRRTPHPNLIRYSGPQLSAIKKAVGKVGLEDDEFEEFMEMARGYNLNPLTKQIVPVVFGKQWRDRQSGQLKGNRTVAYVVTVNGYASIAKRSGTYRPADAPPDIEKSKDAVNQKTNPKGIVSATVTVYQYGPDGQWYPVVGHVLWDERAPLKAVWKYNPQTSKKEPTGEMELQSGPWTSQPENMIAKCALADAIRKGWPEDVANIYAEDEMHWVEAEFSVNEAVEKFEEQKRLESRGLIESVTVTWKIGEPNEQVPIGAFIDRCAAHVRSVETNAELKWWWMSNKPAYTIFHSHSATDFLSLKKIVEARQNELAKAENEGVNSEQSE